MQIPKDQFFLGHPVDIWIFFGCILLTVSAPWIVVVKVEGVNIAILLIGLKF